ncbi:penicillin-binding protein activator [Zooshikella sp. RANM57]|uniref:penicillin-binding protein activator n=1 Tax=Zooshikella sp. RANM57 TaxID=3425863 RepID=UPI003D6EA12F
MTSTIKIKTPLKKAIKSLVSVCLISGLLAGCGNSFLNRSGNTQSDPLATQSMAKVQQLLSSAEQSTGEEQDALRLDAVSILLEQQKTEEAKNILQQLSPNAQTGSNQGRYAVVQAQLALADMNAMKAFDWLDSPAVINNSDSQVGMRAYAVRAEAYALNKEYRAAIDEIMLAIPLQTEREKQLSYQKLWRYLLNVDSPTLDAMAANTSDTLLTGYIQLANIVKASDNIETQLQAFANWQQQWPNHPGHQQLPQTQQLLSKASQERPRKVALLLPRNGALKVAGNAIEKGFFTAYFHAQRSGAQVPEITPYDTTSVDPLAILNQAAAEGAQLAIGPLRKEAVQQLQNNAALPIPIMALNYANRGQAAGNRPFYQFGLSADDEARQAARQAIHDGHRFAVVVTPESDWAIRASEAFQQELQSLGGEVVGIGRFNEANNNYKAVIGRLMNVNASNARALEIQRLAGKDVQFSGRRRQDVDFVFLAASATQSRLVKPFLAYYFAGDLPVYATANVFSGVVNPQIDHDLNNIRFTGMPWLNDDFNDPLKDQIIEARRKNGTSYAQLYVLGIDAFRLYDRLSQLASLSGTQISGASGSLTMNQYQEIERTQPWYIFKAGEPQRLPSMTINQRSAQ